MQKRKNRILAICLSTCLLTGMWAAFSPRAAAFEETRAEKALKPGTAVITARANNGALASAKIRVEQSAGAAKRPADFQKPPQPKEREYKQRYNREMLRLVNNFRKSRGRKALTYNTKIQKAADTRAREAIRRPELGHKRYDKKGALKSFSSVFSDLNLNIRYSAAGENLAWRSYQSSPEAAALALFNQWKNSPGHRVNMLDSAYTSMTTAIAYDRNRTGGYQYSAAAVQLFLRQP